MKTKFLALLLALILCLSVFAMTSCKVQGDININNPQLDVNLDGTDSSSDDVDIPDTEQTDDTTDGGGETTTDGDETTTEPEPIKAVEVALEKESLTLLKGGNKTLTATVSPENTTDKTLTWSSSDEQVATVEDGVVTAVSVGEATITVTTENGKTDTCRITVIETALRFRTMRIDEAGFYGKVAHTTETFSLTDEIEVKENVTFEVYGDPECTQRISDPTLSLQIGDNQVYVREYINGEAGGTYPVIVRRRQIYTVTFDVQGGTDVQDQTVEEDGFVTAPADPTKVGYTFAGWSPALTVAITENTTLTAQWTGKTYVITYDANGGTVANATTSVDFGQLYVLENPTKSGAVFMGWYRGEELIAQAGEWSISENVTLKAKWDEFDSKTMYAVIAFDARGSASEDAEVVSSISFAQELTTIGYENGWYKVEWMGTDDQGNPVRKTGFAHENWLTESRASITFGNIKKNGQVLVEDGLFQYPSYFAEKIAYVQSGDLISVPRGEQVSVRQINATEDWVFIYYNGYGGYFPAARLKLLEENNNNGEVTLPTIPMG